MESNSAQFLSTSPPLLLPHPERHQKKNHKHCSPQRWLLWHINKERFKKEESLLVPLIPIDLSPCSNKYTWGIVSIRPGKIQLLLHKGGIVIAWITGMGIFYWAFINKVTWYSNVTREKLGNESLIAVDTEKGFRVKLWLWLCWSWIKQFIYTSLHPLMPSHSTLRLDLNLRWIKWPFVGILMEWIVWPQWSATLAEAWFRMRAHTRLDLRTCRFNGILTIEVWKRMWGAHDSYQRVSHPHSAYKSASHFGHTCLFHSYSIS